MRDAALQRIQDSRRCTVIHFASITFLLALWIPGLAGAIPIRFRNVVDTGDAMPGTATLFGAFGAPAIDSGTVAFRGSAGLVVSGIFTGSGGPLVTIADTSTAMPGTATAFGSFGDPSIDAGTVAFQGTAQIVAAGVYPGSFGGPSPPTRGSWRSRDRMASRAASTSGSAASSTRRLICPTPSTGRTS